MGDQTEANECGLPQHASLYLNNRCYKIFEGHNIIGRNVTAAVNIKDISISKNHAIITVINSQHYISDNKSANGTNLNTNVLTPLKLYPLKDNDVIQFAEVSATYKMNCDVGDSQNTQNTQSSQLTEDLYMKLTQQLHLEVQRNSPLDSETEIVGTTSNITEKDTEAYNNAASNSCNNFQTTTFHEAPTELIPNDTHLEVEISSTNYNDSFHDAETQVLYSPVVSCSKDYRADASPVPYTSQSKTSELTKSEDHMEDGGRDNASIDSSKTDTSSQEVNDDNIRDNLQSSKTEVNDENIRDNSQSSKTETSAHEGIDDNNRDRSQTDNNDSDESMDFMMSQRTDEIESQLHVELLQRKKRTVLDSDDESDEHNKDKEVCEEANTSTSHNIPLTSSQENQSNLPSKDIGKVDSDCETYIEEGDDLNADHSELYNDTNVIPATQEDLSEVFNYKSKSPRPERTTNHTFESSEDSFRLGLTQLLKDKAETSQTNSSNNMSKSSSIMNEINNVTQQPSNNLPSTSGTNQQAVANQTEIKNYSDMSKDKEALVCSTPIQKDTCLEIKQERLSVNDTADVDDNVYLANTQCINLNQEALGTYNIYAQPTQKLSTLKENTSQIQSSSNHNQSQHKDVNIELSDTEDEIYIENTQPVIEKRYVKSKFEVLSHPTTSKQHTLSKKVDSVFSAETQLLVHVKPPEDIIDKSHKVGTEGHTESPVASTSKISQENRGKGGGNIPEDDMVSKQGNFNHIYSLQTQLITHPEIADKNNTNACDNNVETQMEVSFSQDNLEPTRVLSERPANPLVVILKGDTQEEHVGENAAQQQTSDEQHSIKDSETIQSDETSLKRVPSSRDKKYRLSTIKTTSNIEAVDSSNLADAKTNVFSKTIDKTSEAPGKVEGSNIAKESSKLTSRTRMSTRTSSSNDSSERKDTKVYSTRTSKRSQDSSSGKEPSQTSRVTNESNTQSPKRNQHATNKVDTHTVTLPKKRKLLNTIPEKVDNAQSTNKNSTEDSTLAKRSKRKMLTNVDDVDPEQEPKAVEVTPEETSTVTKKVTRSAGTSNSNEVRLISKNTRQRKTFLVDAKTENDKSGQQSTSEAGKSSEVKTKPTAATAKAASTKNSKKNGSGVKVTSKRISARTRKNSNNSKESDSESHQEMKDFEIKAPSRGKRKTTLDKFPSADTLSTSSLSITRHSLVNIDKTQTPSTSKSEPHQETKDLEIKVPSNRKRKTTLEKFPSVDSLSTVQTPSSSKRQRQKPIAEFEISLSASAENLKSSGSAISTPERRKRTLKPKVVFTMMDSPILESAIKQLGGSIVDSVAACTVLVTEKVKRTLKLLAAIGNAKPICSPEWIHESKKARQFLDPWDFILHDSEAEEKWKFKLSESLHRSTTKKLLDGLSFYINATENVADVLKSAIEASGGKCLNRITKADSSKRVYLITSQECKSKSAKLIKQHNNLLAIDPEGVFATILRQENVLEYHAMGV